MKLVSMIVLLQVLLAANAEAAPASQPVTLNAGDVLVLDNGLVRLGISHDGRLDELSYGGGPNLADSGYWNFNGNGYDSDGSPVTPRFAAITGRLKVVRQSDDLVDIAFVRPPSEPAFFQMTLHYVLRRGDPGFHIYMTASHDAQMPPGFSTQYAYNLRLNPELFDYIAVDETRRHISHTCQEEKEAEKIMDATFRLADGSTVSKYNYTHAIEDDAFHLYGWAGADNGVWWMQGSGEYYGTAPYRVLLTSHQTARTPVIIWQVQCTHRGGSQINFPPGDDTEWEKIYGPAYIYINSAATREAMWEDATRRVDAVRAQWPPAWMSHELFPLSRGEVTGTLRFDDDTPVADAHVILAPQGTHWSQENRGYHFWTKTDADGRFRIKQIRPGRYAMSAVGADQFYEFNHDTIDVAAGRRTDLGALKWRRIAHGRRIWQIGIADRSTGEFRGGDDFHHWGLWRRYPDDFPEDVHFEIGKSSERSDWNFAHWNWFSRQNAWTISFRLKEQPKGTAVLTFGIAAARGHDSNGFGLNTREARVRVLANGKALEEISVASTGSDSYRSARQSTRYSVREIRFDAGMLREGQNTIVLSHALSHPYASGEAKGERGSGPGCIMYDAIRLEVE